MSMAEFIPPASGSKPFAPKCFFGGAWGVLGLLLLGLLLSGIGVVAGCRAFAPEDSPEGLLRVAVAIEPIGFLVERLAGPNAEVFVLIPAGADAHTFQISPRQMAELTQADLFVRIGLALEDRILEKLRQSRPDFPVLDLGQGLARRRFLPEEGHSHSSSDHDHSHGESNDEAEEHHHEEHYPKRQADPQQNHVHSEDHPHEHSEGELGGLDPHIWLSLPLLKHLAQRITEALAERDPSHAEAYRRNLAQLQAELDALDAWCRQQLAPYRGRAFFVFHPAFGYFADCYGLRQMAVQQEGKTPTPQQLRRLIQQAQAQRISVILVQPQFEHRAAQVVADAVGARLVEINPLHRNVLETLKRLTTTLVEAFGGAEPKQPAPPQPAT